MNTRIIKIDEENMDKKEIQEAAKILKEGGLVAFPTETVYGIGANALNQNAVLNIFKAKGRPSDNPLIVHIAFHEDVYKYASHVPQTALKLMKAFWPGPLTLIFKKKEPVSDFITGGLNTVAIRLPSHPIAHSLIAEADLPIAAPSANLSGKPSPTIAQHVIEDLKGKVDMIIDGGRAVIGLESTVLDLSGDQPVLLRPGAITKDMLEEQIGPILMPTKRDSDENSIPKSPGMKYKHYAPKGQLTIVYGEVKKAVEYINACVLEKEGQQIKTAVITTKEDAKLYCCQNICVIGKQERHHEIAANLFKILRQMDALSIEFIYVRAFSEEDMGMAIMNRLIKASGNHIITL